MKKYTFKAINKLLYDERIKRKLSVKDASKKIKISRLRLDLIEKGYLPVPKRKQDNFIKAYKLEKDFFKKYSTFIIPTNPLVENEEDVVKFRKVICSNASRIIFICLFVISGAGLGYGSYLVNKIYNNPRELWTENYTKFNDNIKKDLDTKIIFDNILLDDAYVLNYREENLHYNFSCDIRTYNREYNASSSSINFEYNDLVEQIHYKFAVGSFNKRIVALTTFESLNDVFAPKADAVNCFIEHQLPYKFDLRPFKFFYNGEMIDADASHPFYQKVNKGVNSVLPFCFDTLQKEIIAKHNLGYENPIPFLEDVRAISQQENKEFTAGFYLCLLFGILLAISFCGILLSFSFNPKKIIKIKLKKQPYVKFSIASVSLPARDLPNDTKFTPFIPEFVLKIIGLVFLLLCSVALSLSMHYRLTDFSSSQQYIERLNNFSNNLLIAGTTLLFFVKLDVSHKKTERQLLNNIFLLFLGGLIYYLVQVISYTIFTTGGNIFTVVLELISNFLPGNIIWNLMLYSLIFYFLFVTPKEYEDKPHRIVLFRMYSLIPTLFLIFSFIYKIFIEPQISAPYFISFLFFSKGFIMTAFAIFYLYALFILETYQKFRLGKETAAIFIESRTYCLYKNIIASVIILVLFAIDIFFMLNIPFNSLKLGNNWAIIILIPFIFLYRPHIGKRNKRWDRLYPLLYITSFGGGYLYCLVQIMGMVDFSQLREIMN